MLAGRQPILMLFEDVHWSDPTSVELLDRTVERIRRLPVLLLVTFRPEFIAPWIGQSHVTPISLRRLDPRESATLAGSIVQARTFPARLLEEIVSRADGVPLFLEELTKAVAEAPKNEAEGIVAASPASFITIPATLYTSLAARLDRLGPAKDIAQIGAIIGREFSYELLRDLVPLSENELRSALDRLVASELVMQRGAPPKSSYLFKHALVQQTAYEMLLRTDRRKLHGHVADLLKQKPEMVERHPEVLAQHYADADLNDKAIQYWIQAANRSISRSAMGEAEAQFQKALVRIAILPETRERALLELEIQSGLGSVRLAISGFTAPYVAQTYERARELWERLGCPPEFLRVPWGQVMYHVNRAELTRSRVLAESLMDLAELRHDPAGLVPARLCIGGVDLVSGKFATSRSHLEEALRIYNPEFRSISSKRLGSIRTYTYSRSLA
jgi:predicted ATPase